MQLPPAHIYDDGGEDSFESVGKNPRCVYSDYHTTPVLIGFHRPSTVGFICQSPPSAVCLVAPYRVPVAVQPRWN